MFLLIGCILFHIISIIVMPDWVDAKDVTLTLRGIYEEEENTLDVVVIGNSNVYRGVSPMVLWKEYGITSYSYSSPLQKVWISYYLLKEALEYQTPKVILFDVDECFDESDATEQAVRKVFDNVKMGKNKWEALQDPIFQLTNFDRFSYLFPIVRYHARWDRLKEQDFRRITLDYSNSFKGYLLSRTVKPYRKKITYMEKKNQTAVMGEKVKTYLEKMIQLCKENGIQMVLIELPCITSWSYEKSMAMEQFAKEHEVPFLDLNKKEDIGINWETDTEDEGQHLNLSGAEKVSSYLGKYLLENYSLPDHREEPSFQKWHEDYERYEREKNQKCQ